MSAESPRHVRSGGPLTVPSQPPSDRSIIDAVSGFINDVTLSSSSTVDPKDVIQWARFETADINEPTPEGDSDSDVSPLLLILGYGSGVQVWLIPPTGEAQEVLSWRQGTVRVLRILPTPQHGDCFASKRPLIALCDSASPGPSFCSLSFISIRGGEQVKSIKFKNPILDVLANKRSVVVSFSERFAVFDAATLEDRLSVTTCYPCPCPLGGSLPINPLALGDRWLAYADKKLNQSKRSSGGCEAEGVTSYTATVLHAAKSLSKGLRGLGESVAHSLAGGRSTSQSPSPPNADVQQSGVVTILDIEGNDVEEDGQDTEEPCDPIVAHFIAHSEAIIALKFDASGMLLVTADRRGHDFHVFRINPHPCGPSLASVHHLYILHRGDTTAKVQDIALSLDARWAAVSTLRGTTHVFAVSPYGGACGVRTHTAPRVVNRLSRFHRSAGLPIARRAPTGPPGAWFPNPRLPPYPLPTTVAPLAQLRPTANIPTHTITRTSSGRQRLSSVSEDSGAPPLLVRARFGPAPAGCSARATPPVAALYLMTANGALLHLLLHPKPLSSILKEKISDESCIELEVSGVAQWPLQRPAAAADLLAPLPPNNPLLQPTTCRRCADLCMSEEERWLSQVEIVTHAGPHRRLWMGPQFVFKTYNSTGSNSSLSEAEAVEVEAAARGPARSNPVNMPGARPVVPVLIDSGSASSLEQSPSDSFRRRSLLAESGRAASVCDVQLREDLAEAMKEDHGAAISRSAGEQRAERAWAVDPMGGVVAPGAPAPRSPEPEPFAASNDDEATFRPVLRAPAPPAPRPRAARALPAGTTIPVQSVPPPKALLTPPDAQPLPTAVVIPAALSRVDESSVRLGVADHLREMADDGPSVDESAPAERESPRPPDALPKPWPSADIQPAARSRVRRSPTPKSDSDRIAVDRSDKDSESRIRGSPRPRDFGENSRVSKTYDLREPGELEAPMKVEKVKKIEPEVPIKVEKVKKIEREVPTKVEKFKKTEPEVPTKVEKVKKIETEVPAKVEKAKKIEAEVPAKVEKIKKIEHEFPTKVEKIKQVNPEPPVKIEKMKKVESVEGSKEKVRKMEPVLKESVSKHSVSKQKSRAESIPKETRRAESVPRELVLKEPVVKESIWKEPVFKDPIPKEQFSKDPIEKQSISITETKEEIPPLSVTLKAPTNKKSLELKPTFKEKEKVGRKDDIKTEEQAWDMLLNEPGKPLLYSTIPIEEDKVVEEFKPKNKKTRKNKKSQDDVQGKDEEDTFVEIHAIEDKQQQSSGELVSISTPYEELEPVSYLSKAKKSRASKSLTPERKEPFETRDIWGLETELTAPKYKRSDDENIGFVPESDFKVKEIEPECNKQDTLKVIDVVPDNIVITKDPKPRKNKSLSPYADRKSNEKRYESEVTDVYVIDTMKEEFPEIQITKGKARKKSPQPEKVQEVEIIEKPIKSWSSIAASKNAKKEEKIQQKKEVERKQEEIEKATEVIDLGEGAGSSTQVSLQEKLIELCKRTDIMVAECDAPTELNFVEEHHSVLDLPPLEPLEPLDFGLDDFKLEVMRDSLIEIVDSNITSPICKINIDSILSTIKETTNKAIESSAFNLIDLEKMPVKKERGFSVVENDKITTQEVKVDDDKSEEKDVMEKSSDDDITSTVVSTDSDKDDKKSAGASNITMPSIKQSSKSKKSRKKKK